jgi:hypothetical protein
LQISPHFLTSDFLLSLSSSFSSLRLFSFYLSDGFIPFSFQLSDPSAIFISNQLSSSLTLLAPSFFRPLHALSQLSSDSHSPPALAMMITIHRPSPFVMPSTTFRLLLFVLVALPCSASQLVEDAN